MSSRHQRASVYRLAGNAPVTAGRRNAIASTIPATSPNSRWATKKAICGTNAISGLTGGSSPQRMITYTMAPPIIPAEMIPPGERIPGTLAQAAAPMTAAKATPKNAANAKCRIVPATTCPAETGIALITIACADGLIIDIRLAVVELLA